MGSFKLKLVGWFAILGLLPLGVAFYGYHSLAEQSETRRVDASLEAGLRAAAGGYGARLDAASAKARRLAADPRVARALRGRDREALALLVPKPTDQPAAIESVTVVDRGKILGRISVGVPLDRELLASIDSGLGPEERLVAARAGRIVAGSGSGQRLAILPGTPARVTVGGRDYRALGTSLLGGKTGVTLVGLSPQSRSRGAASRAQRVALSGFARALRRAAYLLGRSVVGTLRRFARRGRRDRGRTLHNGSRCGQRRVRPARPAFNRMAESSSSASSSSRRSGARPRAVARFGEALAAPTTGQLLRSSSSRRSRRPARSAARPGTHEGLSPGREPRRGPGTLRVPLRVGAPTSACSSSPAPASTRAGRRGDSSTGQAAVALENARLHGSSNGKRSSTASPGSPTGEASRRSSRRGRPGRPLRRERVLRARRHRRFQACQRPVRPPVGDEC